MTRAGWLLAALLASMVQARQASGDAQEPFAGWLRSETDHFVFIYEPRDEASARELVGFAEEVYTLVTQRFGYYPARVPVVLRGRTASANGFYAALPHRIELFVTAPSGPWLGARGQGWLRLVLTHELSHYVHLAAREGVFGGLSRVLGHDVTALDVLFMPGWFVEGISTHNETLFTEGGRGRNPFFEMLYKAPLLEGRFWSLKQAAYGSAFAPQDRIYVSGWLLTDYLSRTYGLGAYAAINREFARAPLLGVDHAVKKVTGVPAASVYESMKRELEARFASSAALAQGERVSPQRPGDWYPPRPSQAGWFAYSVSHDGTPGVYRVSPDGPAWESGLVLAGALTDESSFDVSADGRLVAAARAVADPRDPAGLSSFSDLWLLELPSRALRRLTAGRRLWHPALSPDGARLVAVERAESYSRLVEIDTADGSVRTLYEPGKTAVSHPRFDGSGERIVFVENDRGVQDVMLMAGGEVRPLLGRDRAGDDYPVFSGTDRVLFSSDREGSLALYEVDLVSRRLTRIARDRVAAWAGVRTDSGLFYGSYSSDGFCVRRLPASALEAAGVEPEAAAAAAEAQAPGGAQTQGAPLRARPYLDLPRPLVWFPYVGLAGSLEAGVDLPVGVTAIGAGTLQRHSFVASAAWNPYREQPELLASYTWDPGVAAVTLTVEQESREISHGWEERSRQSLTAATTIWTGDRPGASASVGASVTAALQEVRAAAEPFGFADGLDLRPERELEVGGGAGYTLRADSPPRALYGRGGLDAEAHVSVAPAVLDNGVADATLLGAARAQVPAPGRFAAASLSLRGVTSSTGSVADLLPPRGGAPWEPGDGQAKLLASADVRIPLGLLDGKTLGVTLLAAGVLLRAEGGAYEDAGGSWRPLDDLYFGLELHAALMILNSPFWGGAGLTVRLDRGFAEPPGPDDLWISLFIAPSAGSTAGNGHPKSFASSFDTRASCTSPTSSLRGATRF